MVWVGFVHFREDQLLNEAHEAVDRLQSVRIDFMSLNEHTR